MRLVLGITGATGSIYGIRFLEVLRGYTEVETHLVISRPGKRTLVEETGWSVADVEALAEALAELAGDAGRARALGVTSRQRFAGAPDVPTIAEAGLPGFEYQGWYGMLAPGKTPRPIVKVLNTEVGRVLDLPETRERIANQGAAVKRSTPEAFDKLVHDEIETRTKVWKAAGVKVE